MADDTDPTADEVMRDLHRRDLSAQAFGIEFVETEADHVSVRMTVTEEMCNGFIIGHGGMTFLLADSAMAFLTNGANDSALATTASPAAAAADARIATSSTVACAACSSRHALSRASDLWSTRAWLRA